MKSWKARSATSGSFPDGLGQSLYDQIYNLSRQPVVNRDGAADRFSGYLQSDALPQVQRAFTKDYGYYVYVLSQIGKNF